MENITTRRQRYRTPDKDEEEEINYTSYKNCSLDPINSTILDLSTCSLPDATQITTSYTEELKSEILGLKLQLEAANNEIEELSFENCNFKKAIEESKIQIEVLKKLSQDAVTTQRTPTPKFRQIRTPQYQRRTHIALNSSRISPIYNEKIVCRRNSHSDLTIIKSQDNPEKYKKCVETKNMQNSSEILKENLVKHFEESSRNIHEPHNDGIISGPKKRRRIIILADQQGRGIRNHLQTLLGSDFCVTSFYKPGASLDKLIECCKSDVQTLTKDDYVVLLGGMNDVNPYIFKTNLLLWLHLTTNTNIITCEIPFNYCLNEKKLNSEVKFICSQHENVSFIDMQYSRFKPIRRFFAVNTSRALLRQILHIRYKTKFHEYNREIFEKADKSTQTEIKIVNDENTSQTQTNNIFL